jgi:hypothetical protein
MRIGVLAWAATAAMATALAGCSGLDAAGQLSRDAPPGQAPNLANRNVFTGVFGAVTPQPPAESGPAQAVAVRCPYVDVREGTETLRTFDAGATGDEQRLRWQATISETARECRSFTNEVNYVVGASGRVVSGPAGAAGNLTLPVRIVVLRGNEEVLFSRVQPVQVTLPAGGSAPFSIVVDDIRVRREASDPLANVQIYVGFDPQSERPQRQPRRTARRD